MTVRLSFAGGVRALACALLLAGCATQAPRVALPPSPTPIDGARTLVVGVDRDTSNRYPASVLAREVAFALGQRGRITTDYTAFQAAIAALGRPLPDALRERLQTGVLDLEVAEYLKSEGVQHLINVEFVIVEQEWTSKGKRTRLGLSARGHDLAGREPSWQASTSPEVEEEPGRGFQLAMEAGLGSLVRAINREPEPFRPRPLAPVIDTLKKWW